MTVAQVMRRCLQHWNIHKDQVIPRCCLAGWEADLLVIKPSGWCEEVEIKVSAADFRREWTTKAEKHTALREGVRTYAGSISLPGPPMVNGVDVSADPTLHQGGYSFAPEVPVHWYVRRPGLIRRFWFAMPGDLAEKLMPEMPADYGVLAVGSCNRVLRKPKDLKQARKVTDVERLHALQSTYFRFWQGLLRQPEDVLESLALEVSLAKATGPLDPEQMVGGAA